MPSLPVNKKIFNLVNRTSKSFSVIIDNFKFAATLLFDFAFTIKQIYNMSVKISFPVIFNVKKIKLSINPVSLIANMTQTINAKTIQLVLAYQEIDNLIMTFTQRLSIGFIAQLVQQVTTSIIIKKIKFTFVVVIAHFFSLGDYDPSTLLTMDTQTLGQLDQS